MSDFLFWKVSQVGDMIREGRLDPAIQRLAIQIVRGADLGAAVPENDHFGEVARIYLFTKRNVRYTGDPWREDTFRSSQQTLNLGAGDCDDLTILLGSLCQAIGYPVALGASSWDGVRWSHIYPKVGVPPSAPPPQPKDWLTLDASLNRGVGAEVGAPFKRVFRVTA